MGWKDLLQTGDESVTAPWAGGRSVRLGVRTWRLEGRLPREQGWHKFKVRGRTATWDGPADPDPELFTERAAGYLVGDRLVPDGAGIDPDPSKIAAFSERVHLLDPGIDRFARITAGRAFGGGPLIYEGLDMPLGPEEAVLAAFLARRRSVTEISGVTPALDAAFRMEAWQREEVERRRAELERLRREEEERMAEEARQRELVRTLGDGAGRRAVAARDFEAGARAALAVGGADMLDHRDSFRKGEMVVTFKLSGRQFQCVCDRELRIVDAGICLTAHYDDPDFRAGTRGDNQLTLESLPGVIRQAEREGKLVVLRHVGDDYGDDDDYYDYDD